MRKYIIADSTPKCTNGGMEKALLTVDVWEHAYYVDRRNVCPSCLEAWWNLVNWDQIADFFLWDTQPSHLTARGFSNSTDLPVLYYFLPDTNFMA